jgi:hypothetical protein
MPFVESFIAKAFQEDLNTIASLPMFIHPQIAFVMFSFCYVQHPSYFLRIIFPSWSILRHYIKFDSHTIATLEKLLSARSFSIMVGHLVHCQVIVFASSKMLSLPLMVQLVALTFRDVGLWSFLHLSFISSRMITLFFSMWWCMLRQAFFPFN